MLAGPHDLWFRTCAWMVLCRNMVAHATTSPFSRLSKLAKETLHQEVVRKVRKGNK